MIDKITPKFLDKSSDFKLVRKTSLIDALNIYIDTETGDDNSGGVIKPIKGTLALPLNSNDADLTDVNYKALGSVTDENTGIVYFFVFSETISEHGIWAYDSRGVLPSFDSENNEYVSGQAGKIRQIIKAPEFNFPANGFVKGDIVYTNTREFSNFADSLPGTIDSYPQKDAILYFTDNKNEPRKINIYRALMRGFEISEDSVESRQIKRDFISACPRVPMDPISFIFEADATRDINNFATTPGFQFAYQNIYQDGLESAISPYSSIAFPPSIIERGASSTDNILAHNKCVITIPQQNQEVNKVRLLARYGNGANFIEIDEIENIEPGSDMVFDFYNDRVAGGVSPQTVDKTFDNVPQRAESQAVASNRLVYGNYVEGYENVDCTGVNLTPKYLERPTEILDFNLEIKPSIELSQGGTIGTRNKTIGFTYDTKNFPDEVVAGTQVNISFSMSPDKNFHLYNMGNNVNVAGRNSYHQSRQVGNLSLNLPGYTTDGVVNGSAAFQQQSQSFGEPEYQTEDLAGGSFLHQNAENYFGFTQGCGGGGGEGNPTGPILGEPTEDEYFWRQHVSTPSSDAFGGKNFRTVYGTSAGNPLILKGGRLDFSVSFLVPGAVTGAQALFKNAIRIALSGQGQQALNSEFGNNIIELIDVKRTHTHEINLGLEDYDPIIVGTDLSNLICGVGCVSGSITDLEEKLNSKPPSAAFIVNKANVEFYLEESERESETPAFRVCIASVSINDNDDVMTCVRDLDPRSPWWPIKASTISDPTFNTNFLQIWNQNLRVSNRVFEEMSTESPIPNLGITRMFSNEFSNSDTVTFNDEGDFFNNPKPIMECCFGFLNVGADNLGNKNLLAKGVDTSGEVINQFSYSLLDGEGGPGGSGAGEGTAYDVLGVDKYGSIAGQVFVGSDSDDVAKADTRAYVRYVRSPQSSSELALGNVDCLQFLQDVDIHNSVGSGGFDLGSGVFKKRHESVLMGPLYTGRIVMNNISVDNNVGNVNPGPLPVAVDGIFTTTLPLVYFSSWTKFNISEGNDNTFPIIETNFGGDYPGVTFTSQYDGDKFQVSYPFPITEPETSDTGFVDGGLASGVRVSDPFGTGFNSVDFERLHSHMELNSSTTSIDSDTFGGGLSFKSSATHEIGMVYYDERGRHGSVNPIGSVYVKGLGERDEAAKGRAFIEASNIIHTPPSWAKHFKFVYSKNTSIDKFVQYSSGGAFVANSNYDGTDPNTIYVSLNYLQGHPISYSDSFGARGRDNTPVMYSFTPGDRLRVLSYMLSLEGSDINRVYPVGAEFEVTGLVSFNADDTPFSQDNDGSSEVTEAMTGLFLVLKNNDDAIGFRHQSVRQGVDNWGNNCIFEIFSTKKELDADDRLYYEIGDTYDVLYAPTPSSGIGGLDPGTLSYFHENKTVILKDGDVFFRKHAVNLRDFDSVGGFVDMLDLPLNDQGVIEDSLSPESNFKSYYLESEAATDLFPSRAIGIGRPNAVDLSAKTSFNESSIIHSDKDIVKADKVGYSSFNRTVPSTLEIDTKAGPLNYMTNHQDSIFFIQKNKCGHIPVDRNLISDVSGTSSLISSSKFLGTPRYYSGQAGCDGNPEGVLDVDNTSYFAHKSLGKVFKVNAANGVNVISDKNMSTFIRNAFKDAIANSVGGVRVLGGYDPLKKEYLLTIADNGSISSGAQSLLTDVEAFEPGIEIITVDGGVVFEYEEEVEEEDIGGGGGLFGGETPVPRMFIDWNFPSNLAEANWTLVYLDSLGADAGNLSMANSNHNSGSGNIGLSTDLSVELKLENAGSFNVESEVIVDFSIREKETNVGTTGQMGAFVNLNGLDDDFQAVREALNGYGINTGTVNSGFHIDPTLVDQNSQSIFVNPNTPQYGCQFSIDLFDENDEPIYGASETVTFSVPIRFICLLEDVGGDGVFDIQNNLSINNVNGVVANYESGLYIFNGGGTAFRVGDGTQFYDEYFVPLKASVNWQESIAYNNLNVNIDADGVDLVYNPCHPSYGMSEYLEGGVLNTNSLIAWQADSLDGFAVVENGPYALWLQDNGLDPNSEDLDFGAVLSALQEGISPYFDQILSCPNLTTGLG
tara:strand:+ start:575 stop:6790 length:6216 start_codon:yes stop_codon:yes gene_type:complete